MIRSTLFALSAALALTVLPPAASAQTELPAAVITAASLSPEQAAAIDSFIQEHAPGLTSGNHLEVARARARLLAPAARPDASVAFRLRYSEALVPVLEGPAGSEDEFLAVNALRVAAELATDPSATLLERYRADPRPAVRYAAISGQARTFAAIEAGNPSIAPERVRVMVENLGQQLRREDDPNVTDAIVRALVEAMRLTKRPYSDPQHKIRALATAVLAHEASARLQQLAAADDLNLAMLPAFLRAGQAVRDVLADPARPPDAPTVQAAAELAGELLAFVYKRRQQQDFPLPSEVGEEEARQQRLAPTQMVTVAETIAVLTVSRKDPTRNIQPRGLDRSFSRMTKQSDAQFLNDVEWWIGPTGVLVETFAFQPPDRFLALR